MFGLPMIKGGMGWQPINQPGFSRSDSACDPAATIAMVTARLYDYQQLRLGSQLK
jgi:hypothetical protein